MGRFKTAQAVSGTVKSIQHISTAVNESGTNTDISITAVSNVNKAYVVENSGMAGHYGGFSIQTEMFHLETLQNQLSI